MNIARVFLTKTKMTPQDDNVYIGPPVLGMPRYDEIHISVTFTWDLHRLGYYKNQWAPYGEVRVGGPAISQTVGNFVAGRYIKKGVTITSRGCPRKCPWCLVPDREGNIRELPIVAGNIVQDNNLLACSKSHVKKVFEMLRTQKAVAFAGGLDCRLIKDWHIKELRSLKIKQIWLAYDEQGNRQAVVEASRKLSRYFPRDKLRCYVLVGYVNDTLDAAEERLREAWDWGLIPFAMRYRRPEQNKLGSFLYKEREWNLLTRNWTRPAIMRARVNSRTKGRSEGVI